MPQIFLNHLLQHAPNSMAVSLCIVGGENHGKRTEFAFHGVKHHAEGPERNNAEQNAIFSLSENNWGRALAAVEAEQRIADFTRDF